MFLVSKNLGSSMLEQTTQKVIILVALKNVHKILQVKVFFFKISYFEFCLDHTWWLARCKMVPLRTNKLLMMESKRCLCKP